MDEYAAFADEVRATADVARPQAESGGTMAPDPGSTRAAAGADPPDGAHPGQQGAPRAAGAAHPGPARPPEEAAEDAADEWGRVAAAAAAAWGREVGAAAAQWRRETGPATDELRRELGAAGRETMAAVREAMEEARRALRESRRAAAGVARTPPGADERPTRAQRKELTRELLLDAAVEVFAEKGYNGASLDDVADAAGFTKGAVYSNFATKGELFLALCDRHASRRGEVLARTIRDVPIELLPDLAQGWLRTQADEERDWDILTFEFWLAAVRDPRIRERLAAGQEAQMASLGSVVDQKLVAAGRHPGLSGREIVTLVNALGIGQLMSRYLDPEADTGDLFARAIRKLLADEPRGPLAGAP